MWRLGSEDPGVWPALRRQGRAAVPALSRMQAGYDIDYVGQGELLKVSGSPSDGQRQVTFDAASGLLTAESINHFAELIFRNAARGPPEVVTKL